MRFAKFALTAVALLGMAANECATEDPGKNGNHKSVVMFLRDGSVLTKQTWGMYKASTDGPFASSPKCRWTVTKNGKLAASGGVHDAIISTHGITGGVVHMTAGCQRFARVSFGG